MKKSYKMTFTILVDEDAPEFKEMKNDILSGKMKRELNEQSKDEITTKSISLIEI